MRSGFEYHRPQSPGEAVALKTKFGAKSSYWAGGTDVILQWHRAVRDIEQCIDLTHMGLNYIRSEEDGIHIGALTTLAQLEKASAVHPQLAILDNTAKLMCTPQSRTLATVGGNICNAAPSADMATPLVVLGATVVIENESGQRTLPIDQFFKHVRKTDLAENELLVEIIVPVSEQSRAAAYTRIARTAVDIALVGASAALTVDAQGEVTDARIALCAVAPTPARATEAEQALIGQSLSSLDGEKLAAVGKLAEGAASPITDIRGTVEFRSYSTGVMVRRALEDVINTLEGER